MNAEMNTLFETIARDFAEWRSRGEYGSPSDYSEFLNNLSIDEGRKYLKVVKDQGNQKIVWGFIVKEDDGKFRKGDILKAASWSAPARNKARGNIFEEYDVQWTGPNYL
jgi:hypothetical protein